LLPFGLAKLGWSSNLYYNLNSLVAAPAAQPSRELLMAQGTIERSATTGIVIRRIRSEEPFYWLAAGWHDLWTTPLISVGYGVLFALIALGLTAGLTALGWQALMLPLVGGFLLVGPLAAVGLYEVSRRLERGESVGIQDIVAATRHAPGQVRFFGAVLLFVFFVWGNLAFTLLMGFLGGSAIPPLRDFVLTLLFTPEGLGLLVVGSAVGGILAVIVYAISAISLPLLMTRELDVVTAMLASLEAVLKNPWPMALWAILIAGFILLGIATAFLGFIVAFPLIGHATWHAFRSLVADRVIGSPDRSLYPPRQSFGTMSRSQIPWLNSHDRT
jgi:uncharacterized membrane protein